MNPSPILTQNSGVQVRETIADLQREVGITTVFVTHDQEEALAISDRIGLMRLGRLEQVGARRRSMPAGFRLCRGFRGSCEYSAVVLPAPAAAGDVVAVPLGDGAVRCLVPAALPADRRC